MKLNKLQVRVINNFLNLLVVEIANNYLDKLKNFRADEVDEIVLKFLDNSIFLAQEKIDIMNEERNSSIVKMSNKEIKKFEKATSKRNSYSNLFKMLNFIYIVIKEEEEQKILFNNLYSWYDKREDDLNQNQDLDIYKEIKPWIRNYNTNSNLYSGQKRTL